jgi:hypothetical protein
MKKIQYFMQEGCRSCLYGEWLLRKNQGWEDVIELVKCIDPKTKEWSQYAKDNMIDKTPTLLAFDEDGNEVARLEGGEHFTSGFWKATLEKHGK